MGVRITTDAGAATSATISLTRSEASELADAIADLLGRFDDADFHVNVSSGDFANELTLIADHGSVGQ